jgi:hypothetical protein
VKETNWVRRRKFAERIWIDFAPDDDVGEKLKRESRNLTLNSVRQHIRECINIRTNNPDYNGTEEDAKLMSIEEVEKWTPVVPCRINESLITSASAQDVHGTRVTFSVLQFHMIPAEAMTIHKSQGQTYRDGVVVNFGEPSITRALRYVAMSRVESLDKLWIHLRDGCKRIEDLGKHTWAKWTDEERKNARRNELKRNVGYQEVKRMRVQAPLLSAFPFLKIRPNDDQEDENEDQDEDAGEQNLYEENDDRYLYIFYHNVQSFPKHMPLIQKEKAIQYKSDVLFFVECHSRTSTNRPETNRKQFELFNSSLPQFKLIYLSGGTNNKTSNGTACYVKKGFEQYVKFVADN